MSSINLKQLRNQVRQKFLLTFFDKNSTYGVKEVNGFILIKQWNGSSNQWEVAIYTIDAYDRKSKFLNRHRGGNAESLFK